jgi:hypothetical protein
MARPARWTSVSRNRRGHRQVTGRGRQEDARAFAHPSHATLPACRVRRHFDGPACAPPDDRVARGRDAGNFQLAVASEVIPPPPVLSAKRRHARRYAPEADGHSVAAGEGSSSCRRSLAVRSREIKSSRTSRSVRRHQMSAHSDDNSRRKVQNVRADSSAGHRT